MEATLLLLAGGRGRRMGRAKPWIEVGDTVLLRYVVERLAPAFSEVMVSFSEPEQMEQLVPYRVVFDRKRAAGPLAGLEAGNYTAHDVVELMDVTWLEGLDPAQFESLNTPADLERFNAALSAQR